MVRLVNNEFLSITLFDVRGCIGEKLVRIGAVMLFS